ncbi:M35 family deuterolysin metalloprotease [Rhizoctonia solani 123E]|uniref:M35 family deuterolysin metalloprotease n=1 Tax=Rhizoctonia solani 123E TaxID=1423351 RepID=A0A074S7A7_9AGAM|nr:M35 family deuterolysin metalloprotease [Rhizoctonia solani 123E]
MRALLASTIVYMLHVVLAVVPSLRLTVTGPLNVTDVDNLFVKTTVTNTGLSSVKLLKNPSSVLSDWQTNSFSITGSLGRPFFTGIRVKYSPELALKSGDESNFITLAAGESFELTHSLAGAYNFTGSGAGEYSFSANNVFQYVDESGQLAMVRAETVTNKLSLSGSLVSLRHMRNTSRRGVARRDVGYKGCSSGQLLLINTAIRSANEYIANAIVYLDGMLMGTPRYMEWFGPFDLTRFKRVKSHFENMGTDASSTIYDCGCKKPAVYAYVYQDSPGYVYLCDSFWTAPETGTNSRAGTIVHEQSHFVVNGGTEDHVYGLMSAHALAVSDPDQAIDNADNHEYFVENNPVLS